MSTEVVGFETRNTIYALTDAGDGAYWLSGHGTYCPTPVLVTLAAPPQVGRRIIARAVDPRHWWRGGTIMTTEVQRIITASRPVRSKSRSKGQGSRPSATARERRA